MTTRPSDRALSKALEELRENATVSRDVLRAFDWIGRRAREIDAKPAEGLLPCPFCGGEAKIFYNTDAHVGCTDVQCTKCLNGTGYWRSEATAVARWNRREGRG